MKANWIRVNDRLPKLERRVLLYWNGTICCGYREEYGNSWIFTDGTMQDYNKYVTHWMSLPREPKPNI